MYLLSEVKKECFGCEACVNICPKKCIEMVTDQEGFYYPAIKRDGCINCHICEKVCPIECLADKETNPVVFAVKHKNKRIQMESSSGGAFTAIAEKILDEDGVVYATGFAVDNSVVFERIDKQNGLKWARKSKYVQSRMKETHINLMNDLKNGRRVLFVGTACQCDSVVRFLDLKNVNKRNLLLVDIICHGVASPQIWSQYLQYQENIKKSSIQEVDFRDKKNGWAPMRMNLTFEDGSHYENYSRFDGYYRLFFGHYIIRPACHDCHYTSINRKTDLTIADFWGIKDISPELYDEYGVSMVIANSDSGKSFVNNLKDNANVKEVECDDLTIYQPNLKRPTFANKNREEFWEMYNNKGFNKVYKKYGEFSTVDRLVDDMKNIIVRMFRR